MTVSDATRRDPLAKEVDDSQSIQFRYFDEINSGFTRVRSSTLIRVVAEKVRQLAHDRKQTMSVVIIDGKPAAGKSTWADSLLVRLGTMGCPAGLFEADWCLYDRDSRSAIMQQLEDFKDPELGVVVPRDFHHQFWDWNRLNEITSQLRSRVRDAPEGEAVHVPLHGLYDRTTGACDGVRNICLERGSVLVVPGSYLLAHLSPDQFDISILLDVSKDEGIRRKASRESEKGEFPTMNRIGNITWSWELIEEPTFQHHMTRYGRSANIIIDNTEPALPSIRQFVFDPTARKQSADDLPLLSR